MIVIALYNLKGGVGKTASCVNFAYLAAADGFKTLLWDIDPQGSSSFYYKAKPKSHPGIKKLITKDADLENAILATDFELLDIIPADHSAKSFDIMVDEMKGSKNRLKSIVKQLDKEYDFVFIDCPPGFSALSENIFQAADIVLMPMEELNKDKRFFQSYIPYLSDVEKMGVHKAPIMEFANSSNAAISYRELWTEIKEGVVE
jgi:chromosome partitioning protein